MSRATLNGSEVLLLVGGVVAAIIVFIFLVSSCCSGSSSRQKSFCDGPWARIKSQADADNVGACNTYSGGVTIDPSYTGSLELGGANTNIAGDLICISVPGLTSISSESLNQISGSLLIENLKSLSNSISFPRLNEIDGKLSVVNNEQLSSITAFSALAHVQSLEIKGAFSSLNLSSLSQVSGDADILSNSMNLGICDFIDNLKKSNIIKGSITCQPRLGRIPAEMMAGVVSGAIGGAFLIVLCTVLLSDKWIEYRGSAAQEEQDNDNDNDNDRERSSRMRPIADWVRRTQVKLMAGLASR